MANDENNPEHYRPLKNVLNSAGLYKENWIFLSQLQRAHDAYSKLQFPYELLKVARNYELIIPEYTV